MATFRITGPDGGVFEITAPDDATEEQVLAYAKANYQQASKASAPATPAPANNQGGGWLDTAKDAARQVGLTARYGLEGVAGAAEMVTEPLRQLVVNPLAKLVGLPEAQPLSQIASEAATSIGLPKPETAQERIVGEASRAMAGGGGLLGATRGVANATQGLTRSIAQTLAANPSAQLGGAAGSGVGGGVAREAEAGPLAELGASLAGGVAGGLGGNAAMRGVSRVAEPVAQAIGVQPLSPAQALRSMDDTQLSAVLRNRLSVAGGDWDGLSQRVRQSLMDEVRRANDLDGLRPEALRRLGEFRELGLTPTRGTVSRDFHQYTLEKNLAKAGVNSRVGGAEGLGRVANENNAQMIRVLQGLEGASEVDPITAGRTLSSTVRDRFNALERAEREAWDAATNSPGYRMPVSSKVLSDVNAALDEDGLLPFMDGRIASYMRDLQTTPERFTPQTYRNLMSMLSKEAKKGGNEAAAAGRAMDILREADLRPAATMYQNPGNLPVTQRMGEFLNATDQMPNDAMRAIDAARAATRQKYAFAESPIARRVLSDGDSSDPERLAKRFIIGATPDEAREVAGLLGPQGSRVVRDALATEIKRRALNGAADEVGNISQKALNSALRTFGPEKLSHFFSPEDIAQLGRLGRVASYIQVDPTGSAVNHSNSGAMLVGKGMELLSKVTGKIPLLNIDQQIATLVNAGRTASAMKAGKAVTDRPEVPGLLSNIGRGATAAGLLAVPKYAEGRKNDHR